jgi:hypothetical protein
VKTLRVDVPEWGGAVLVKAVGQDEQTVRWLSWAPTESVARQVSVAIACCVTEDGAPLFTPEDAAWLGTKSAAALGRVFKAACEVNGVGPGADRDRRVAERRLG